MKLEPAVLENPFARLEPLAEAHPEALRAACAADPDIWTALYPISWAGAEFEPSWLRLSRQVAAGQAIAFAVIAQGRCVGLSSFLAPDAANASVEIGGTYYRPDARGGPINPGAKRLLMGHAFDTGARRVVFRVDALNLRSRAAVLKLGAVQEGVMRQDRVTWTGRVRDTVVFSVLAGEWPAVRDRLDARLAAFANPAAP